MPFDFGLYGGVVQTTKPRRGALDSSGVPPSRDGIREVRLAASGRALYSQEAGARSALRIVRSPSDRSPPSPVPGHHRPEAGQVHARRRRPDAPLLRPRALDAHRQQSSRRAHPLRPERQRRGEIRPPAATATPRPLPNGMEPSRYRPDPIETHNTPRRWRAGTPRKVLGAWTYYLGRRNSTAKVLAPHGSKAARGAGDRPRAPNTARGYQPRPQLQALHAASSHQCHRYRSHAGDSRFALSSLTVSFAKVP